MERDREYIKNWTPIWFKEYIETPGPKNLTSQSQIESQKNELFIFSKIMDQNILNHIAFCINEHYEIYIINLQNNKLPILVYISKWRNLDRMDILLFISCHLFIGTLNRKF